MPKGAYAIADAKPLGQYTLANATPVETPGTNAGLGMKATAATVPMAARAAAEVATNPNLPKLAATAGRVIGGAAPVIGGLVKAGPAGAAIGMAGAMHGARAGAKTGAIAGALAQKVTAPIASILEHATPYVQALSTLSGAQGVLDLAQMAEPNRTDIGLLGVGKSTAHDSKHPALINLALTKLRTAFTDLIGHGLSKEEATQLLQGHLKGAK